MTDENRELIHIVRKSTPRFTKSPSLVLIGLIFTEIEALKTKKIYKEMYGNADKWICPDFNTFLCKFFFVFKCLYLSEN